MAERINHKMYRIDVNVVSLGANNEMTQMYFRTFSVKQTTQMKMLKMHYSETLYVPINFFRFQFDGKTIEDEETPIDLGMEQDDIIEVYLTPSPPHELTKETKIFKKEWMEPWNQNKEIYLYKLNAKFSKNVQNENDENDYKFLLKVNNHFRKVLEDEIVDTERIESIMREEVRQSLHNGLQEKDMCCTKTSQLEDCFEYVHIRENTNVICHHNPIRRTFHLLMGMFKDGEPARLSITAKPSTWFNTLRDNALFKVAKILRKKENIEALELPESVSDNLKEYFS